MFAAQGRFTQSVRTAALAIAKSCTAQARRHHHHVAPAALAARVERVLAAKTSAGLTYDALADRLGVTNTYAAQLLLGQAKLTAETAKKLVQALPALDTDDLLEMQTAFPMRAFDDQILKEPHVYRTYEAVTHYGEAMKSIINEQCGDGIMSAIDFYCDVGVRVVQYCRTLACYTCIVRRKLLYLD